MAFRLHYGHHSDIGVFAKLTNSYCILAPSDTPSFYGTFEGELGEVIPVVYATVGGMRAIGRLTAGNKRGLLVSNICNDQELGLLRNSLPDGVCVRRIEERLSFLGNTISCNDHVSIIHPQLDRESEEIISDTLGVEVFRESIGGNDLVGSTFVFTNRGGLVPAGVPLHEQDALATLAQVLITASTINNGARLLAGGFVVNDWSAFVGQKTTPTELSIIEAIFKISAAPPVTTSEFPLIASQASTIINNGNNNAGTISQPTPASSSPSHSVYSQHSSSAKDDIIAAAGEAIVDTKPYLK